MKVFVSLDQHESAKMVTEFSFPSFIAHHDRCCNLLQTKVFVIFNENGLNMLINPEI